jgi:integrase
MPPLQKRRFEVCQAIVEHVATVGRRDWNLVQAKFPDLPPANFWRYRRETLARLECEATDRERPSEPEVDDESPMRKSAAVSPNPSHGAMTDADRARQAKADERLFPPYGPMAALFTDARNRGLASPRASPDPLKRPKIKRTKLADVMVAYDAAVLTKLRTGASRRRSLALVIDPLADRFCADLRLEDFFPHIQALPPVHANRILVYLNAFFVWAHDRRMVDYVPPFAVLKPVEEVPRERSLTLSEIADVWRAAETIGYPFGPAIQLLILTVASREDVASMRKSDIYKASGDQRLWLIYERTHGERARFRLPLPPKAFEVIKAVWLASPPNQDLLFTTTGSTPISGWSRAKRKLDATILGARVQAGDNHAVAMPPWRLNDLRRSFFDLSIEHLGEDEFLLGRCLNRMTECKTAVQRAWSSSSETFDVRLSVLSNWPALVAGEVARNPVAPR